MNRIVATMDDLPELPFEKVLSYLSLEDRLKARAVSRRWYHAINSFKVKSLCYSRYPSGFIMGKGRWVRGAFAQNFIGSSRFSSFFNTFSPTILSTLKHLRLCGLHLNKRDRKVFARALNSFGQLEELDLIDFTHRNVSGPDGEVELNLPMLASIHLERVKGIDQLALNAPRLKKVKLLGCSPSLRLKLVHADSVEWLATDEIAHLPAKNLKSLKYLYCGNFSEIDSTFLSDLEKLKEVHLNDRNVVLEIFEQKQLYGRTNLKVFLCGFLLNGPEDPAIDSFDDLEEFLVHLSKNPSRLADEIPLWTNLDYSALDGLAPESAINVLSRFTDLNGIGTSSSIPAPDVQRFLDLLKNFPNIVNFHFSVDQPQDLFDRLPEHSAVQFLIIDRPVSDLRFLARLEHLIAFKYSDQITTELVPKAFEELQFLQFLEFKLLNKQILFERAPSNNFSVSIDEKKMSVADLKQTKKKKKKRNKRR